MVVYGLDILPLIKHIQEEVPDVHQPWYAYVSNRGGQLPCMHEFWDQLDDQGGSKGYSPYPIKFILVTGNHTLSRAKEYFSGPELKVANCKHYLGSWLGGTEG